tara:strand:- start:1459 stop:1914 length:456 start_codon:yes stop_codon:yes gene_type:complete
MKSQELKKILKPLIKECVKEMMIEEGFLSSVVSEVIKGMNANVIVESRTPQRIQESRSNREEKWEAGLEAKMEAERQERIRKLNESMKSQHGADIFAGVEGIPDDPSASAGAPGALSGIAPDDSGVDISGIMNIAGGARKWGKLAKGGSNV